MVSTNRALISAVVQAQVSAVFLVLSFLKSDGLVGPVTFAQMVLSAALAVQSRRYHVDWRFPLIAQVCLAVCAGLMLYVLGWKEASSISQSAYSHIEGVVYWGMVYPVAFLALLVIANLFDQRYNRILIGGFTMFLSIGICTLSWVFVSLFCRADLDVVYFSSQEMAYLFVNLVLSLVAFFVIAKALKGKGKFVERRLRDGS